MKNLKLFTFALCCLLIASCTNAQFRNSVSGEGPVVTEKRAAQYFSSLTVSSGIDVFLTQGNNESIEVEAEGNLMPYIKTEIRNNALHVYIEPNINIRFSGTKKVHVTMKDITSVKTSSAGDVTGMTPITSNSLKLATSSAGDIKLDVNTTLLDVTISSAGNVALTGKAEILNAELSSAGDLEAYDLVTKEADVTVSSAGGARINVTDRLQARSSSAGDIYYAGNPEYVDAKASSAGGIHKR